MIVRNPLAPAAFLKRAAWFELGLAALQLMHLALFAQAQLRDFAAWAFVHTTAQLSLFALRRSASRCRSFAPIPWRPLAVLLLLTFAVKLYSRAPYIAIWLSEGLWATRASEDVGGGGIASFVNIFFYPLAILLAFASIPQRRYVLLMVCVCTMCVVDFVFLGTRNAPLFVLLFHLLASPLRLNFQRALRLTGLVVAFVAVFSYSTINRTQESQLGTFDWIVLFEFTGSTENLKIDPDVAQALAMHAPLLLPAVFLSHYVTHSISELALLVDKADELPLGGGYYVVDQFCVVGTCSRADSLAAIENANPRAGTYQTAWGSLLFDFGLAGAALAWIFVIALIAAWQRLNRHALSLPVALVSLVVALAPIENYLYNGLGLVQILTIMIAYQLVHLFAGRRPSTKRQHQHQPAARQA